MTPQVYNWGSDQQSTDYGEALRVRRKTKETQWQETIDSKSHERRISKSQDRGLV